MLFLGRPGVYYACNRQAAILCLRDLWQKHLLTCTDGVGCDIEDLMELCGPLGKFQDVSLSGVGLPLLVPWAKSEATHGVAGLERVQTPLMIQSVVVEVV